MTQRLHLHNCPSKPFMEIQRKHHRGSWSDNHHFINLTRWQIIQVIDILYSQRDWLQSEPKKSNPLSQEREGDLRPSPAWLPCAVTDLDGSEALLILKTKTLLYHNALQPIWVNKKEKNQKREKKKSSSITMLINTKGYPILYTVVCDICGPYKMLSLSLDFVLILSWCIKY